MSGGVSVDVVQFLEELGVKNVHLRGNEVYYSCPFEGHSNDDQTPSASMHLNTTGFHCFGCGRSGNAVAFLSEIEGVSPIIAARWIRERFGSGDHTAKAPDSVEQSVVDRLGGYPIHEKEPIPTLNEVELRTRLVDWEAVACALVNGPNPDVPEPFHYISGRFPAEVLTEWEFGLDMISSMICFPYRHHDDGRLIGFKGRAWWKDARPRYRVLGNKYGEHGGKYSFPTLDVSRVVFGGHRFESHRASLVVAEGELNAISLNRQGIEAIGISGRFLSAEQADIIASMTDRALLWYDDREDAISAARRLASKIPVSIVPVHAKDPADSSAEENLMVMAGATSWVESELSGVY